MSSQKRHAPPAPLLPRGSPPETKVDFGDLATWPMLAKPTTADTLPRPPGAAHQTPSPRPAIVNNDSRHLPRLMIMAAPKGKRVASLPVKQLAKDQLSGGKAGMEGVVDAGHCHSLREIVEATFPSDEISLPVELSAKAAFEKYMAEGYAAYTNIGNPC